MRALTYRAAVPLVLALITGALAGCPRGGDVVLLVSPASLDFGSGQTSLTFQVSRTRTGSDNPVVFTVGNVPPWATVSPAVGDTRGPSDKETITVTVDRSKMNVGENGANLSIGATNVVPVTVRLNAVAQVVADFEGSPTLAFVGDPVEFTDTSRTFGTGVQIVSREWLFGDDAGGSGETVTHTYAEPGTYDVTLNVALNNGATSTRVRNDYIVVEEKQGPTASFTASTVQPIAGQQVLFTDTSNPGTAPITSWEWDFDSDGTVDSTVQNPSFAYPDPGVFTATLRVTTEHGTDSTSVEITVAAVGPTANFSGTPRTVLTDQAVTFVDQSNPGTSPITSWAWDFENDGTVDSTQQNPSHTYTQNGVYSVSLTVTTEDGTDSLVRTNYITVTDPIGPTADFSADLTDISVGEAVTFTDLSDPGTGTITSWLWNFGDGGISTSQSPSHTYSAIGTFQVSLTVTTQFGQDTETKTAYITVSPIVDFTADETTIPINDGVQFTDLSIVAPETITNWFWDFGDGLSSTSQNPVHRYGIEGSYTVSLTITLSNGEEYTVTKPDYITAQIVGPTAEFSVSNLTPAAGEIVDFTDLSDPGSAPIQTWEWNLGNGVQTTAQNTSTTYPQDGPYTVTLTVTTIYGTDTATTTVNVGGVQPTADFIQSRKVLLRGFDPVTFTSTSTIPSEGRIASYTWYAWNAEKGDTRPPGSPPRSESPEVWTSGIAEDLFDYPWQEPGFYHVELEVASTSLGQDGPKDSIIKLNAIEVREPSPIDMYVRFPDRQTDAANGDFAWSLNSTKHLTKQGEGYTEYELDLLSQAWDIYTTDVPAATPRQWNHTLRIIRPDSPKNQRALLYLDGPETAVTKQTNDLLIDFALAAETTVVVLTDMLNQPLFFPDEGVELSGHELMAKSMQNFLDTGDARTIALMPMVKAGVRAMDATSQFLADPTQSGLFPPVFITDYVVAGGDLQAWAAWLLTTVDPRIAGIIPMAFDSLNLKQQIDLQEAQLGQISEAWDPYTVMFDVFGRLSPNAADAMGRRGAGGAGSPLRTRQSWFGIGQHMLRMHEWETESGQVDAGVEVLDRFRVFLEEDVLPNANAVPSADIRNQTAALIGDLLTTVNLVGNPPAGDTPFSVLQEAVLRIAGEPTALYGGSAGALRDLLIDMEQQLLLDISGAYLQFIVDPIFYSDPFVQSTNLSSPYGNRLRVPKYIINGTGDSFANPLGARLYYSELSGPKRLRFIPNTDHSLTAPDENVEDGYKLALTESLPWFVAIQEGLTPPRVQWTFLADNILRVQQQDGTASAVYLWLATNDDLDFRIDPVLNPNPPVWNRVGIGVNNGVSLVQVPVQLEEISAYFVELLYTTPDGEISLTTEVGQVDKYTPPQF